MTALSEVLDAIEARWEIVDYGGVYATRTETVACEDVSALLAGVRAVLALHRPSDFLSDGTRVCLSDHRDDATYPCATVRALSAALGVSDG